MSRSIPYDESQPCDICHKLGASDFMGDYYCPDCVGPIDGDGTVGFLATPCRVYWGSHGCSHPRGHDSPHECSCCNCLDHAANNVIEENVTCVAKPPYYGADTMFYGEDAEALGLRLAVQADE